MKKRTRVQPLSHLNSEPLVEHEEVSPGVFEKLRNRLRSLGELSPRVVKVRQQRNRGQLVCHAVSGLELLQAQLGRPGVSRLVEVRQDGVAQPASAHLSQSGEGEFIGIYSRWRTRLGGAGGAAFTPHGEIEIDGETRNLRQSMCTTLCKAPARTATARWRFARGV